MTERARRATSAGRAGSGRAPRGAAGAASPYGQAQTPLLRLQSSIGNRATTQILQAARQGAGLRVSAPGDVEERQADRLGEQAVGMTVPTGTDRTPSAGAGGPGSAPRTRLAQELGPGVPLDPASRADFEPRFGWDLSQVRVHTDERAAATARAVSARAYTTGADIAFAPGHYDPRGRSGRLLLAHELAHVVQQVRAPSPGPAAAIQRKGFESTFTICHQLLETRKFDVTHGGLRVVLLLEPLDQGVPNCSDFDFWVTLTRSEDWWPDDAIGTCESRTGTRASSFTFSGLSPGTYYLTIARGYDNPNCCLAGDVLVFDEAVAGDSASCRRDEDLSAMEIVHGALDLAGFIPVLGAIPDGVNAAIYAVEGDWANAGLSAVATVPFWGDGVKAGVMAGKSVLKVSEKAAFRLGSEGIARGLTEARAVSKEVAALPGSGGVRAAQEGSHGALSKADEEYEGFLRMLEGEGATGPVRATGQPVELLPHARATETRRAVGLTGEHQSAHGLPQSVGRGVPGYSSRAALTTLHERAVHGSMDRHWQVAFRSIRRQGRSTATGQEVYDAVAESIQRSTLSQPVKESLVRRLQDEMFVELGMSPTAAYPLPHL